MYYHELSLLPFVDKAIPLKQGLKLILHLGEAEGLQVDKAIPLKQGLKQVEALKKDIDREMLIRRFH